MRPTLVVGVMLTALMVLAAPVAAQPADVDVYIAEGVLALDNKQYETAIASFRRALERDPNHVEALYLTGIAHLALDRPADAAPLLERAFAREPRLDSLGYYVGLLRFQNQQYQAALKAFRAGRTNDPNIAQLTSLYAGLSLAALGLPAHGAEEIERAVRMQPASPLTGPAERLRASLATGEAGRRLRASARLGVYADDNARAAPDQANSVVVSELRRSPRRTIGELFTAGVEYDWLRRDEWTATAGYTFLTTYNNAIPALNVIDHLGTLGVSRRDVPGGMPLDAALQYSFEYLMLGGRRLLVRNGVAATGTLVESARHLTNAIARVDVKDFEQPGSLEPSEVQDAVNGMFGVLQGPVRVGIPIADLCSGIFLAQGVLVALIERETTGQGQWSG